MNILFIGSYGDWHIDLWVKYFVQNNSVYLFSDKEDYLKNQPFDNVTVIESSGYLGGLLNLLRSGSHRLFQINKIISAKYFAKCVDDAIRKYNIEIVHAHSLYYGYLSSFTKSEIPIVFTPMGSDVILHAQKSRIYKYMAKRAFKRANIITGDSILLQKRGLLVGAKIDCNYIIQNGVESSTFLPKTNSLRAQYSIKDNEILIFSPRGITPIYNIDVIVESISKLVKKGYKIKCMFSFAFGDEYSQKLKLLIGQLGIKENVIWLGLLTYQEMAAHYNASDIVVSVPSSDSSPKSVYEAMFCGKPIVITDLEWSYELLGTNNCVSRVAVRNSTALANAISRIIDDDKYAKLLSSNALLAAHKYFDYSDNMKRMEKIMVDAISGSAP
ncbi:hypothetical protein MNBD_GAMMA12-1638 [hydrothermal vent metagenome]|uniref:Glycosyltransferase n=1 Tax=hydrothermal vent metagenome TaxID=652676 RepID=A0A3B0Z4X5_9ZZZZ